MQMNSNENKREQTGKCLYNYLTSSSCQSFASIKPKKVLMKELTVFGFVLIPS